MQGKRKVFISYLNLISGSLITAISIDVFLVPYRIAPGGVSGIATVIFYLSKGRLPVGVVMLSLNIPLFLLGLKYIGKKFVLRTLFSTIFLSAAIDALYPLTGTLVKILFGEADSSGDIMIFSVYGGVIMGIGLGIVFRSGATTGGTDLAARIIHHNFPGHSMGRILFFVDGAVIVFASVAFNSVILGLYSMIALFISSKVIDTILEGLSPAKAVYIISEKTEMIANKIMTELDRGVTGLKGTGKYTGKDMQVLLCVLNRAQLPALKELVRSTDEKAFVILTDVREVVGEGFSRD